MVSAVGEASSASHEHEPHDANASCSSYGGHQKEATSLFQFTTGQQAVAGQDLRGRGSRDPGDGNPESTSSHTTVVGQVQGSGNRDPGGGKSDSGNALGHRRFSGTMELKPPSDKPMDSLEMQTHCVANLEVSADGCAQSGRGFFKNGGGDLSAQYVYAVGQGTEEGDDEVERMEFEGEGEAAATC